ncbi:MAG: photosynthetic reaction center subunit H [Aestuariivirga sp.]|uniref:photosynthetic reaction center subunit H n=1 Tax=Aestuariivirga sp. TaxID=2650926 RepID=UPI0025BFC106|nr:photosynthetic reaction center subunit H [Aestuariivirga sp.]MCA3559665.1 photosynthetic reaction center subunit H [Aestuariivirga sp.]
MSAALTQYVDVAQVVLYVFWAFLAGIIIYLHREDKREGYPLESERSANITVQGWPAVPAPKTYLLADGSTVQAPRAEPYDGRPIKATPIGPWPGAPLEPDGDAMVDGVGPASYAERLDIPDALFTGEPKLSPLRNNPDWHVEERDPDPRGMPVIGCDGKQGGTVKDVWVDRSEYIMRYLEVEVSDKEGRTRNVLLPTTLARIWGGKRRIEVKSITSKQFIKVPGLRNPDVVTRLEEDKICAFYAGGHLYAIPDRAEPLV